MYSEENLFTLNKGKKYKSNTSVYCTGHCLFHYNDIIFCSKKKYSCISFVNLLQISKSYSLVISKYMEKVTYVKTVSQS